jgi:integrase
MPGKRKQKNRVYWRSGRAWGDFRDYADCGGRLESLTAPGERLATQDPDVAADLAAARLKDLDALRHGRALHGRGKGTPLAVYAAEHLEKKAKAGKVTHDWMAMAELFLTRAVAFLGADRNLESVTVENVQAWAAHLATLPARKDTRKPKSDGTPLPVRPVRTMTSGTVRHALNALSNLYRRAQSEGEVAPGFNPVAAMMEKPIGARREARWLEVPDAALLVESARTLPADPWHKDALPADTAHAIIATFLLTGGRGAEVLGLEVDDVSFDRQTVTFRQNDWRRLKTLTSARVVPLWPQLAAILRPYAGHGGNLLFPSYVTGKESMLTDWRGTLDRVAERAGWKRGEIRSKMFRHTYCSARLQTLDGGAPVSPFTVSRELGHGSGAMVEEVYSHLGTMRHRTEVVEYRVEQHRERLKDRLASLERSYQKS